MTDQEIFDTVVSHLLQQGKPASDGDYCVYRTTDGLKCAIGVLIPDDEYIPTMEGCPLSDDIPDSEINKWVASNYPNQFELLVALQTLHDKGPNVRGNSNPKDWDNYIRENAYIIATEHHLKFKF